MIDSFCGDGLQTYGGKDEGSGGRQNQILHMEGTMRNIARHVAERHLKSGP